MRNFLFIAALLLLAAMSASCKKDNGGVASSEGSAVKGGTTSMVISTPWGQSTEGSAFMYKTAQTCCFLLCEGTASSWSKALLLPHLEIHIWESYIATDVNAMANPATAAIDINSNEKKVYVCWSTGKGQRFFDKNHYASATGNYTFESGSVSVLKVYGIYSISFMGSGSDGKDVYGTTWTYAGSFKGM